MHTASHPAAAGLGRPPPILGEPVRRRHPEWPAERLRQLGRRTEPPEAAVEPTIETRRFKRLEALGPNECHWPMVEDAQGVQLFCGCRREGASTYCSGHLARARRRPKAWERQALEPARRPSPREGLGWDRFDNPQA